METKFIIENIKADQFRELAIELDIHPIAISEQDFWTTFTFIGLDEMEEHNLNIIERELN